MSAFTGEHSSGASAAKTHATDGTHVSPDVTNGHMTPPMSSTVTPKEAREPCSPPKDQASTPVGPAEAETTWITEHKDDPDEEGPHTEDETAEEQRKWTGWRPENDEARIECRKAAVNKKATDRNHTWRQYKKSLRKLREKWHTTKSDRDKAVK